MKRIALIDADTDIFAVAARSQINVEVGEAMPLKSVDHCLRELIALWEGYQRKLDADGVILMLTDDGGRNWRKSIYPDYKATRKDQIKPVMLAQLRAAVQDRDRCPFVSHRMRDLEADDLCGIASTKLQAANKVTPIIVSCDKDLKTIPGLLWNPRPTALGHARELELITDEDAFRNHMLQTLQGDSTDNYPGCPGVGPKRALTFVNSVAGLERRDVWDGVVGRFIEAGLKEKDAVVQAQVSYILQSHNFDPKTKKITPWTPEGLTDE
jgi:5'-3' exonuclease